MIKFKRKGLEIKKAQKEKKDCTFFFTKNAYQIEGRKRMTFNLTFVLTSVDLGVVIFLCIIKPFLNVHLNLNDKGKKNKKKKKGKKKKERGLIFPRAGLFPRVGHLYSPLFFYALHRVIECFSGDRGLSKGTFII